MDLQAERDLIKDEYGNYYIVSNASGDALTVINVALYYAFNHMLNEELVAEVRNKYPNEIACGKFFADLAADHIERLEKGEMPGTIYAMDEVKEKYDLHIKPIYDESLNL